MFPEDLKFATSHEWLKIKGKQVVVGISSHAQEELGEVVFVELPEINKEVERGTGLAVIESIKAISDVFAPVSGKVVEVNTCLEKEPQLINTDPYGEGYICVIELSGEGEIENLMDSEAYCAYLKEED